MNRHGKFFLALAMTQAILACAGCQTTRTVIVPPAKADPEKIAHAKEILREVPAINEQVAETFYQQGLALEEEGLGEEAIGQYMQAIHLKPTFSGMVHTHLGMLYREKGQYALARDALQSAVQNNPGSALAYYQLALVWIEWKGKEEHPNALMALDKAIEINPDLAEAHYQLGQILWNSQKTLAAEHFRRYLQLAGDRKTAATARAKELLDQWPLAGEPIASHQLLPPSEIRGGFSIRK